MASGKKGKKTKGKTLALTDFLQETTGSIPTQPIRKSTTSWADEVDEYDASDHKIVNVVLPTAPKASRDFDDIADKVPTEPPFMAYLSNLPYDVDEDEIADFFRNMKIAHMRIPKDERPGEPPKLKGFGYVEFEDRESLMSALIIPDTNLKNRRIRIEVATNADNDRRGGRSGGRMGMMGGDRMDTGGDWRSSNRPEPVEERRGGFGRDRDRDGGSSGGFTREGMREGGRDYGGFNRDREGGGFSRDREGGGFNRDREGGGFNRDYGRNRDRDEGFNRNRDQDDRPGAWRDGERSSNYNDRGFSRGYNRDDRYNREDREDRQDRRGGGGFRRNDDSERNGGVSRSSNRGDRDDREPEAPASESRQRPRLNLAPRTKPIEQAAKSEPTAPSASIFGNAKPVDTAERERQIEEKLLREQEERLTENTKDRDGDEGERKVADRSRAPSRRDDKDKDGNRDREVSNRDRGPPSRDRGHDSGDERKKQEKPKREEKRDKPEKELPKFQEPETPNFQGSNKYALLEDGDE